MLGETNVFPSLIQQMSASLSFTVTKICNYFSVSCIFCHMSPGPLLPQPQHQHTDVSTPKKRVRKISKDTMRAVYRSECAVFVGGWKTEGQYVSSLSVESS